MTMTLKEHCTPEEIRQLVQSVTKDGAESSLPNNNNLINCSHYVINGAWKGSKLRFFSFPASDPLYVFIIDEWQIFFPNLYIRLPPTGHDSNVLKAAVPLLLEAMKEHLDRYGRFLLDTDDEGKEMFLSFLADHAPFTTAPGENNAVDLLFYMNEEQRQKLLQMPLETPPGYNWSKIGLNRDLSTIHNAWPYGFCTDIGVTRSRIECLPYACIKTSKEGQLASWELTHNFGMVSHLFVQPSHRGLGLGPLTELKNVQEYIRRGLRSFKFVAMENESVVRGTMKHPLWTNWTRANDSPLYWTFTVLEKSA